MIKGIEPGTSQAKALREWAEEQRLAAMRVALAQNVDERAADHARGRLSLADEILDALKPKPPAKPAEKRTRDTSGY